MYEAVHATPDGRATVARFAATAADYGFDGIVVRNHGGQTADYDPDVIATRYGIDVVDGVEIRAESPSQAAGFLGRHRPETTVVLLHGGSTDLNRFAVDQSRVDVLAHPMHGGDVDHVIAKTAAENDVRLEFNLASVVRDRHGTRSRAISRLRKLRELVDHYGTPYVVSADPTSHLELRAARDLVAVGEVIGFDRGHIETGLREWGRLADRNRHRQSDSFVQPGVYRARGDEDDR